jgi:hypothetical protein
LSRVNASVVVPGRPAEAEALWLDETRWPSWIDGFGHVQDKTDNWPEPTARLRWVSTPHGRGLVAEEVTGRRPGESLALEVEDAKLTGTQTVVFAPGEHETRVTLTLEYELKDRTAPLSRFFVRRALKDSLARTLRRFANERRAELSL